MACGNGRRGIDLSGSRLALVVCLAVASCIGAHGQLGPPPIAPAPTSVTVFVGTSSGGPVGELVQVGDWLSFSRTFVGRDRYSYLWDAMGLYFRNGGSPAGVIRLATARSGITRGALLSALGKVENCNLLCLPGITDPSLLQAAAQWCEKHGALLLVDLPASCDTPQEVKEWLLTQNGIRSPNVAAYLPWLRSATGGRRSGAIPPSGAVAAIFGRTDKSRGVWKAPAGTEAEVAGVLGPTRNLRADEADAITASGANYLRVLPDNRTVVWGARTMSTDPEWKYVPIRRLFLFIEHSVSQGTEWAVFEPNDAPLWQKLRVNVTSFMLDLYRQGAFQGTRPEDAFFVKCDTETTTSSDIQQGLFNILIGFAPLKPAEFVIVRIQKRTTPPTESTGAPRKSGPSRSAPRPLR